MLRVTSASTRGARARSLNEEVLVEAISSATSAKACSAPSRSGSSLVVGITRPRRLRRAGEATKVADPCRLLIRDSGVSCASIMRSMDRSWNERWRYALLLVALLLSGISGLINQIAWQRAV